VRVLTDGTYLTVVMDSAIRGARRERILAAARAGHDLDEHPDAIGKNGLPLARLARVIEYDVPDRAGNGTGELPKGAAAGMNPFRLVGPQQIERPHPVPRDTPSIITSPDRTGSST